MARGEVVLDRRMSETSIDEIHTVLRGRLSMILGGKRALLTGGLGSLVRAQAAMLVSARADVTILEQPGVALGATRATELGCGHIACDLNDLAGAQKLVGDW